MKRTLIWVGSSLLLTVLAILAVVLIPMFTHQSAGSSGQVPPKGFVSEVTATGEDGNTRQLSAFKESGEAADLSAISPGQEITVRGSGYDSSIGVYVGICLIPEDPEQRPTPCLGGIPEDAQEEKEADISAEALESAWVTNNWAWKAFASHSYLDADAGTFEVTLLVPDSVSEGLDCNVLECGLYTRADHTALSDRVQDIYMPVAFTN